MYFCNVLKHFQHFIHVLYLNIIYWHYLLKIKCLIFIFYPWTMEIYYQIKWTIKCCIGNKLRWWVSLTVSKIILIVIIWLRYFLNYQIFFYNNRNVYIEFNVILINFFMRYAILCTDLYILNTHLKSFQKIYINI